MKVVNTIDLKNKTEDDLEDFVLEHSRKVRKMLPKPRPTVKLGVSRRLKVIWRSNG